VTTANSLDSSALQNAIASVRRGVAPRASMWLPLIEALDCEEAALREALDRLHGVTVIDDTQWPRARAGKGAGRAGGWIGVDLDGLPIVLCNDPWSTQAIRALGGAGGGARLALARPGQIEQLSAGASASVERVAKPASAGDTNAVVDFVDKRNCSGSLGGCK